MILGIDKWHFFEDKDNDAYHNDGDDDNNNNNNNNNKPFRKTQMVRKSPLSLCPQSYLMGASRKSGQLPLISYGKFTYMVQISPKSDAF